MTSVDEALSYDRDAVGIGRKGTIDKPYLLKAPFWTVDTLFYAIPKSDIDLEFVHCSFLNVDWKSKDESTGLPSLSKEAINETIALVPSFNEQSQLGEFFNNLDTLITLHQRMCSIFCFCAFGSRTNFNQSSKDSFGYYATSVPCRRCARCHRHWLQASLTSPRRLRFRFFLRWRFDRLASARKNSIISLMRCRSGSLSSPLRGSVACVSRVLDSGGGARLPCRISGAVGLRANHEKWRRARKSRRQT